MKDFFKSTNKEDDPFFFRLKNNGLEEGIKKDHQLTLHQTAIPLGRSLAQMSPCMPDEDSEDFSSIHEIEARYQNQIRETEVELQVHIQPDYIESENGLAEESITELIQEKKEYDNEYRIARAEVERCDPTVIPKHKRYKKTRPLLALVMFLDMFLSGSALESAGLSKLMAYGIGLILGAGIFFLSERIWQIADRGRTVFAKRFIAFLIFFVCSIIFYYLGELRVVGFSNGALAGSQGIKAIYFCAINLFMMGCVATVSYFVRPSKAEQEIIDKYNARKKDADRLYKKAKETGLRIKDLKVQKVRQELTRKQITQYAQYLRNLIQGYFEESVRSFQSTNRMHRIDGKTPAFFKLDIPQLPHINLGEKITKMILVLCTLGLMSCGNGDALNISVLEDITEPDFLSRPDDATVNKLFGLDHDIWRGTTFRYGVISSLSHTKREVCMLPSEMSLLGNTIERQSEVNKFKKRVRKVLSPPRDSIIYHKSSIWIPVVEEIKMLQKLETTSRLYLFTDLAENSTLFSVQRESDMRKLVDDPDSIKDKFLSKAKDIAPSMGNLQVVVVYQPATIEEDIQFAQLKDFYGLLFSDLGVPISFVSNL